MIPQVVASERGAAQTRLLAAWGCRARHMRVTKQGANRTVLERPTREGDSPVGESLLSLVGFLSSTGHANPVRSWGVHSPRLNTFGDR